MSLLNPIHPPWPAGKAFPPKPVEKPLVPATRDELLIENHELKKQVAKLEGQVDAFLMQEQHPLQVLRHVLECATYDRANRAVVIDERELLHDKLGDEVIKIIDQNTQERLHKENEMEKR